MKKRMSQRRRCLAALAGRSYGSNPPTLRTAYIAYIRSVADYGAAFYSTHAAPSVRARLEAEQHKCARMLTGCIRLTNSDTLITEAGLPPLAVRGRELAAMEQELFARLPPEDPARALAERHIRPRLKHRAHEAWLRLCPEARRRREPPPNPPPRPTRTRRCRSNRASDGSAGGWPSRQAWRTSRGSCRYWSRTSRRGPAGQTQSPPASLSRAPPEETTLLP